MAKIPVFFLTVSDNASKLKRICDLINEHFLQGSRILIVVHSQEVALYIDQLLWRMPEESFLPHEIAQGSCTAPVVITMEQENLNQASILLNLCPTLPTHCQSFQKIYDLYDKTQPNKESLSQKRQSDYQTAGHTVTLI